MAEKVDLDSIVKRMISEIQSGELVDDNLKLPSEPLLMKHYQITHYALRQALKQMNLMGYVYQVHGVGTFVRHQQTRDSIAIEHETGLSEKMRRIGINLTTKTASQRVIKASEADFLSKTYHFKDDDELIDIKRYRCLDGKPYLMEHSYYRKSLIDNIPMKALYGSLFEYFEESRKTQIGFIDEIIMSTFLPQDAAEFMNLSVNSPSLLINDESYLSNGELLAFSKQYYNYENTKIFVVKKIH